MFTRMSRPLGSEAQGPRVFADWVAGLFQQEPTRR